MILVVGMAIISVVGALYVLAKKKNLEGKMVAAALLLLGLFMVGGALSLSEGMKEEQSALSQFAIELNSSDVQQNSAPLKENDGSIIYHLTLHGTPYIGECDSNTVCTVYALSAVTPPTK
ncbi:hypothetical protein C5B42_05600 [Candidatus Cerribacteria bacterium 'Amazon FNV 2010 28 9']|uniref:Uncharacterized protein n=1 Tax=Candidatus Cerribacteria bacterium 'Amazon FNV 2010 28 9' TaxID=2081795 RepID=A0A317JM84_9BACT|nr:MAG: hypothetical protein C5B42_05600 [Candidatus Cerribacteria bacterium 'Amazon FNV 2010 28 9']